MQKKQTFALYFGNRGFFPESPIASAREEAAEAITVTGCFYKRVKRKKEWFGICRTVPFAFVQNSLSDIIPLISSLWQRL